MPTLCCNLLIILNITYPLYLLRPTKIINSIGTYIYIYQLSYECQNLNKINIFSKLKYYFGLIILRFVLIMNMIYEKF